MDGKISCVKLINKMGSVVSKQSMLTNEMTPCAMMLSRIGIKKVVFTFHGGIVFRVDDDPFHVNPYTEQTRNRLATELSNSISNDTCNMIVALLGQNINVCVMTENDGGENGAVIDAKKGYRFDGPELVNQVFRNRFGSEIQSQISTDLTGNLFAQDEPNDKILLVTDDKALIKKAHKKHMLAIFTGTE